MKTQSLRKQFLRRILIALLIVVLFSSFIQLFFIKKQISNNVETQASIVAHNVMDGITQTETASKSIEHQIDLKMIGYAKNIYLMLDANSIDQISNEDLIKARDELGIQGITIFERKNNDIVGVKATDSKEIGFSFKQFGPDAYKNMDALMNGENTNFPGFSFSAKNIIVLPISQSGSHQNQPIFNKYAYYHPDGTNYVINPYIEENQVYKFTQAVGPNQQIKNMLKTNNNLKEIAVINPKVFKDPSLEKALFNPQKKVEFGTFALKNNKDIDFIKQMVTHPKEQTIVQTIKGKKLYQMFIPAKDGRVIYLAFDYNQMSMPLYRHSIILIFTGLLSLVVLFLLTARFFNRIYENIQKIKVQIKSLETGDLTAKSDVRDKSELENLSESANKMADKLNTLIKNTQNQAYKTQKLSFLLESAASESIDKMYQVSTEATMKSRDQLFEITEFNNLVEQVLQPYKDQEAVKLVLDSIDKMRDIANERTSATTDVTLTLSDLLKSLHGQSSELSEISNTLLEYMEKFKL
jgi:methyl-accepting chemotaxis protein